MSERQFSEEEIRAIEAEMEKLTVDDVLLQTLVTLINLGARKAGLATPPGKEDPTHPKRDLEQMVVAPHAGFATWHRLSGRNRVPAVRAVIDRM